jgi:hypothetical protein
MITVYHFPSYLYQYIDIYKMEATGHRCGCATFNFFQPGDALVVVVQPPLAIL